MTGNYSKVNGEGRGNNGPIILEVLLEEGKISEINVKESQETETMAKPVFEELKDTIISKQKVDIDSVSGATVTSQGFLGAVKDAIEKSPLALDSFLGASEENEEKEDKNMKTDVLVIGTGGAGLAAAASASKAGANVILLEKLAVLGGSTALSGGGIAATGTKFQKERGIEDSKKDWLETWKERQATSNPNGVYPNYDVVEEMMDEFVLTTEWLSDEIGHHYRNIYGLGVDPALRLHDPEEVGDGLVMGQALVYNLEQYLEKAGVPILTETEALDFLYDKSDKIAGIKAESKDNILNIEAKKVILATGGFAKNEDMLEEYIPDFAGSSQLSAATVGATGDGIKLALEAGAEMYEEPWIIGLGIVDFVAPSALGNLAFNFSNVYVNEKGERFMNEADHYAIVTNHVAAQERPYLILDSSEANTDYLEKANEKMNSGEVSKADTLEELAQAIEVPAATFQKTMEDYNNGDEAYGKDEEFLVPLEKAPYYAVKIYPMTMGTFSGVKTDEHFNVLNQEGKPIPNLYAVGETANKILYNQVYMSGSAVQFALTSGRLSGAHAAQNI